MQRIARNKLEDAGTLEKLILRVKNSPIEDIKKKFKENSCYAHGKNRLLTDRFLRYSKRVLGFPDVSWHGTLDVETISPKEIENFVISLE